MVEHLGITVGRSEDEPELARWTKTFEQSGHRLVPFLTEIAAADAFRVVSPAP